MIHLFGAFCFVFLSLGKLSGAFRLLPAFQGLSSCEIIVIKSRKCVIVFLCSCMSDFVTCTEILVFYSISVNGNVIYTLKREVI